MPTRPPETKGDGSQGGPEDLLRPHRSDLDFLRGLADRRGEVFLERLPGLRTAARATLAGIRGNAIGPTGGMILEVDGNSELALLMGDFHARGSRLERLTVAPLDYATMVELRELVVTRIDGSQAGDMVSVHLTFPYWP